MGVIHAFKLLEIKERLKAKHLKTMLSIHGFT